MKELEQALNALEESRLTEAERAFDAAYDEAWRNKAMEEHSRAQIVKKRKFWERLTFQINSGNRWRNATPIAVLEGNNLYVTIRGFKLLANHYIDTWNENCIFINDSSGDGRRRSRFPMKKYGGYDWPRMAEALFNRCEVEANRLEREKKQNQNNDVVADVMRLTKLKPYNGEIYLTPSSDPAKPINIRFNITKTVTADAAERIINLLRDAGLTGQFTFEKE